MWLNKAHHFVGPLICKYWRLEVTGEVDAIPAKGGAILAANHSSFLDPWLLGMALPRNVRFLIGAKWYHRSWFWNRLFRAYGTVPVDRGNPGSTIDAVCETVDRGDVVGIFPEGHVSHDGRMHRFRRGIARIAAQSGTPVIPLGIQGSFDSMPRTKKFPRPRKIIIRIGTPLAFRNGDIHEGDRAEDEFLDRLFRAVSQLHQSAAD